MTVVAEWKNDTFNLPLCIIGFIPTKKPLVDIGTSSLCICTGPVCNISIDEGGDACASCEAPNSWRFFYGSGFVVVTMTESGSCIYRDDYDEPTWELNIATGVLTQYDSEGEVIGVWNEIGPWGCLRSNIVSNPDSEDYRYLCIEPIETFETDGPIEHILSIAHGSLRKQSGGVSPFFPFKDDEVEENEADAWAGWNDAATKYQYVTSGSSRFTTVPQASSSLAWSSSNVPPGTPAIGNVIYTHEVYFFTINVGGQTLRSFDGFDVSRLFLVVPMTFHRNANYTPQPRPTEYEYIGQWSILEWTWGAFDAADIGSARAGCPDVALVEDDAAVALCPNSLGSTNVFGPDDLVMTMSGASPFDLSSTVSKNHLLDCTDLLDVTGADYLVLRASTPDFPVRLSDLPSPDPVDRTLTWIHGHRGIVGNLIDLQVIEFRYL